MILMRNRCTKQGHNPIARDLVHGPFVGVHRVHHALEHGVEELPHLLGITISQQLYRAFEVGEEHGRLFALALQGTPGR